MIVAGSDMGDNPGKVKYHEQKGVSAPASEAATIVIQDFPENTRAM